LNQPNPSKKLGSSLQKTALPALASIWSRAYQSLAAMLKVPLGSLSTQASSPKAKVVSSTFSLEAHQCEIFLQSVPESVTRQVLLNYSIGETADILRLFSEETRSKLLNSLKLDSPLYQSISFYLESPVATSSPITGSKNVQNFVYDMMKGIAFNEAAGTGKIPPNAQTKLASSTAKGSIKSRAKASSLTISPKKSIDDNHIVKAILLYSFDNPTNSSKETSRFLSGIGIHIDPIQIKAIWKRYDLLQSQKRLQWATEGDDNATLAQKEAVAIIRDNL
jgi:hypothetical protein